MNTTTIILLTAVAALTGYTLTAHRNITLTMERHHMSTQAQLDALVSQLNKAHTEIVDRINKAQADIDAQLAAAGVAAETIDLSALTAIAQQLDDIVPDAPETVEALTESVTESVDELETETAETVEETIEVDEAIEETEEDTNQ